MYTLRHCSAAGYSVITYLLGVGDRHLDNLLLSESGHLIHVDFGYILGRDPKVFPPPMKLNKEMVEGMGGTSSIEYQRFREHCYNAFLALRRYDNNTEQCRETLGFFIHVQCTCLFTEKMASCSTFSF